MQPDLDPIRRQFDFPDERITPWLEHAHFRLPPKDPNSQIWATTSGLPFVFGGTPTPTAPLEIFFRRFKALLPPGHWETRNNPAVLLPAMIEPPTGVPLPSD